MRTPILITTITAAFLASTSIVSAQNSSSGRELKQEPSAAPNAQMDKGPAKAQDKVPAQAQDKAKDPARPESASKPPPATTGQGNQPPSAQQKGAQQPAQNAPSNATSGQGAQQPDRRTPNAQPQNSQAPSQSGSSAAQSQGQAGSGAVALTAEQKTTIRQTVLGARGAPRVANVNFSVNVGTEIPPSVRLVAVPEPLYRFHPAWRGYVYFIVGDEIIIVDARTHRIIAVLAV